MFHRRCQVVHPNVAFIYDADQSESGQPYVVMEYVRGESLGRILDRKNGVEPTRLDPIRAIDVAIQVCRALAAAHRKQIIHRDIKPDNILIVSNPNGLDLVKVVDFGLAKAKELSTAFAGESTETGVFVGTPRYSSPEQASGSKGALLDHRTDSDHRQQRQPLHRGSQRHGGWGEGNRNHPTRPGRLSVRPCPRNDWKCHIYRIPLDQRAT
jgi:serine/threonine protein kinase